MQAKGRILAVDDNQTNLGIIEEALEAEYQLEFALSGEECLERVEAFRPDIVLLDIMMPGIDGYETCKRLREMSTLNSCKIILVSARAMVQERLAGYEVGADDYIVKPFDCEELRAKVQVFMGLKSSEEVEGARLAGMAEIATNVLHNVGNLLNSIKLSAFRAHNTVDSCQVSFLTSVADLVEEHEDDLATFVAHDERGKVLPRFLRQMSDHLLGMQKAALEELTKLARSIDNVKQIISVPQPTAGTPGTPEPTSIPGLVEDALEVSASAESRQITVQRQHADLDPIVTDKNKVLQILINLIRNAIDSVVSHGCKEPRIGIRSDAGDAGRVRIMINDNGAGIDPEDEKQIFHHGFSTKPDGHGFGLHWAAMAASELGGAITVDNHGIGKGATFILELPCDRPSEQAAA